MNRTVRQFVASLAIACMMLLAVLPGTAFPALAASGKIQFSDPAAAVGSEVTVNLKVASSSGESLSRADIALSYDSGALEFISGNSVEGGSGALRAHGSPDANSPTVIVFSMKFKAKQAGSSQITVTSQEVYDGDSQLVDISHVGSSTVTVQAVANASSDASLASLQVSPGTLSPAFSSDVDTYSVNVGVDVERLTVNVQPTDSGATYVVTGNEDLQMGENTVVCKVTAQDGQTVKSYTITVLKNEEGASAGSEGSAVTAESVSLEAAAKAITIIPLDEGVELPEGFLETTIDIDGHKVTGWVWESEEDPQYCVFYGMNAAGEKNFYRYDLTEKTIQRYFQDPALDTGVTMEEYTEVVTQYNELLGDFQIQRIVMIVLIAVVLVLFIVLIYLFVKGGKSQPPRGGRRSERELDSYDRSEEDEEEFYEDEEERYLRSGDDGLDDFEEIQLEPQVRRPREAEDAAPEPSRRPAPRRAAAEEADTMGQTQVLSRPAAPARSAGNGPVRREGPQRVTESQRPARPAEDRQASGRPVPPGTAAPVNRQPSAEAARKQPALGAGPAGQPAARPARPEPQPAKPVNASYARQENDLDDDDFEFLDIDE